MESAGAAGRAGTDVAVTVVTLRTGAGTGAATGFPFVTVAEVVAGFKGCVAVLAVLAVLQTETGREISCTRGKSESTIGTHGLAVSAALNWGVSVYGARQPGHTKLSLSRIRCQQNMHI